ncbi:hypothetical protein ARMSODRAFT_733184 [Armillaria solidipes]|uniref:Uncharacterized protein n=1 Tax=Armillaria solidipes TaxID=1076256 RepID=A0A2H3AN35_9AGAR|nr:hypothetical protein ARMSODRAFT_733184 [Armillaria solidipes]
MSRLILRRQRFQQRSLVLVSSCNYTLSHRCLRDARTKYGFDSVAQDGICCSLVRNSETSCLVAKVLAFTGGSGLVISLCPFYKNVEINIRAWLDCSRRAELA